METGFKYPVFVRDCTCVRKRLKLSIPQLSKLSGVSATMLYYFEDGQRVLSRENCHKVYDGLIKALDARQKEDEKIAAKEAALTAKKQKDRLADQLAAKQELAGVSALLLAGRRRQELQESRA